MTSPLVPPPPPPPDPKSEKNSGKSTNKKILALFLECRSKVKVIYFDIFEKGFTSGIPCHSYILQKSVTFIRAVAWDSQQFGICDQHRLRPACAYAQTDLSLCWWLKFSMTVKLLIEPHLRFLSLKGGCTGLSEPTLVKIPHCWKSCVTAHFILPVNKTW